MALTTVRHTPWIDNMYERFFGLRERPFELTPNPRYLLLTSKHAEALAMLQYGISARKGITVLVGEAGTGKTTLVRAAVSQQSGGACIASLTNPLVTPGEFLEYIAQCFGLQRPSILSRTRLLADLAHTLERRLKEGLPTALVIDEAHALSDELFEEVRLLVNLETDEAKLLPLILAGQPELGDRLNTFPLRQLKQRVALRCTLNTLDLKGTALYVAGRIKIAGGDPTSLFTGEAVEVVYAHSQGIPRLINVICDNALLSGFASDRAPIDASIVLEACRDLDLDAPRPTQVSPSLPGLAATTLVPEDPNPTVPISPLHFSRRRPAPGDSPGDRGRAVMAAANATGFPTRRS